MTPFDELMSHQRETTALGQVAGRLGWDQETVMPRGSAEQRAEEMAAMETVLHARRTDPRVGEWLAALDEGALGAADRAQVRLIRREYERAVKVPGRLAAELARVTSRSQGVWAEARAADDFTAFASTLERVVALKREEGAALAAEGDVYDALLDDYEPGMKAAELDRMFGALRPRLVALREAVLGKPRAPELTGDFDEAAQMKLSRRIAQVFGYDMKRGRVDKAVHPFSSGSGNDVRITTRTAPDDPFNCVYSTIHEVGHGAYEQGIDQAYLLTPVGQGVSMGVHESQSRIYENQLGRSRAFTAWLFGEMADAFGNLGVADADAFYAAANRVHPGYIRTESDEVQYNLHILMRYDLERALIGRSLEVADLEEAWNTRFEADFGTRVDRPSNGVLQDVHWSVGLFGYFPTYTLGNVYAGCLHKALRAAVPDLDATLAAGETAPATEWLRERLQRHGGLRPPRDTVREACGFEPGEGPLLDYLEAKFGALYGL
ncbi:thermostable carboxypeptidase [Oceanicola granulosus HTCC2516]|uniref:Metal-dependent carboxypeptidase n=1 Tax=Oceanicola granulosus (strain ATCC BAA-861 / DSM 15982 / KCTC 12143 / HTCC2516) TaxID=314256 RepID=Q2CHZ5_OCEGH|nr:carboxypeptidase M32 [Oceanicola granulosus]EAR52149.1 thermostable carboxypeptidase [Oceanicola granulosus HTCC2516]